MGEVDKQLVRLGGIPVILHSLRVFESFSGTGSIVLVMSEDNLEEGRDVVGESGLSKIVDVVAGVERRQDSVKVGLKVLASHSNGIPEGSGLSLLGHQYIDYW